MMEGMVDEPLSNEAMEEYKHNWLKKFRNYIAQKPACLYGVLPWESLYGAAMDDDKQWPPVWKPWEECPEYCLFSRYTPGLIKQIRETRGYDLTKTLSNLIPVKYSSLKGEDECWQRYTLKCKVVVQKINERAKDYKKQYVLSNVEKIVSVLGTGCNLLTFHVKEVPYPDDPVPSDVQKTVQAFVYAPTPNHIFVKEWRFKPEEQVADMINISEDESTAPLVQRRHEFAVMVRKEGSFKRFCRVGAVDDVIAMDEEQSVEESIEELKRAMAYYLSGAGYKRVNAFRKLRKLLSKSENSQVEGALKAGALQLLSDCLNPRTSEEMLEAIRCLTNIAAGNPDETKAVLHEVELLILIHMDGVSSLRIAEQCAWVLGNVAGEGEKLRDAVLSLGGLVPLARMMVLNGDSTGRTAAWALSNLIMGPNARAATELIALDGVLDAILRHLKAGDEELATEVAWVVVYLTALSDTATSMLAKSDLLQILVDRLVSSNSLRLLIPVLRGLGNLVAGDIYVMDTVLVAGKVITANVIQELSKFLQSEHGVLVKESAWLLSNIAAAGSVEHKKLIHTSEVVSILISLLLSSNASFDVRKEVGFALANLCASPGEGITLIGEHLVSLVNQGCVGGFYSLARSEDVDAAMLCLQLFELVVRGMQEMAECREFKDRFIAVLHFLGTVGSRIRDLTRKLGHAVRCDTLNSLQVLWLSLA